MDKQLSNEHGNQQGTGHETDGAGGLTERERPNPDGGVIDKAREAPAAFEEITPATAAGGAPLTLANLTGQQVGRYRIEQQIGSGGVAMVYQAYDQVQGIPVALKVLMPHADANTYSRFRREALTAGGLRHPHIVRILQVGTLGPGGLAYIAMELVDGESLGDLLTTRAILHPQESCNLLEPIARALHHAHAAGIVHRDVKPSNILLRTVSPGAPNSVQLETLDHPVVPLLSDFGVARYLDAPELTNTGRTVGTPAYMAPEQCAGRRDIDGRADIYALGCVLYRCVTGRLPFSGAVTQILHAHVYEPLTIDNDALLRLPPTLVEILSRSLAKQPDARYATVGDMAEALAFAAGRTRTRQQTGQADSTKTLTLNTPATAYQPTPPTATTVLVPGAPGMTTTQSQSARQPTNPLTTRTVRPVQPTPAAHVGPPVAAREESVYRFTWAILPIALALLVVALVVALVQSPFGLGRNGGDGNGGTPGAGFLSTPTTAQVAVVDAPPPTDTPNAQVTPPPTEAPVAEATPTPQPEAILPTPTDTETPAPPTLPPATWTPLPPETPTPTLSPSPTATVTETLTPTETWTPEPTETPVPLPTDTPTPEPVGCGHLPDPVWVSFVTGLAPNMQQGFVCAHSPPETVNVDMLMLENGFMLRMDNRPTTIYLYFSGDNHWELAYSDGDLAMPDVPIPGPELFVPRGVFGQVWEDRQLSGALGFALAADPDRFPGRVQTFPGGTLIYNFTNGRVVAFFADGQS